MLLIDVFIQLFILICGMLRKIYKTVRYLPASIPAMSEHINFSFLKRKHSDSSEMKPFSYADAARKGTNAAPQTGAPGNRNTGPANLSHQGPPQREDRSHEQHHNAFDSKKSKVSGGGRGPGHQGNQNRSKGGRGGHFQQGERRDTGSHGGSQTSHGNRNQGYGQRDSNFVFTEPGSSVDRRQGGQTFHQQTSATNTAQRSRQNSESKDYSAWNKTMSHSPSDSSAKSPSLESPTKSHCVTPAPAYSDTISQIQTDYDTKEKTDFPKESEKSDANSGAKRNKRSGPKDTAQGNAGPVLKDTKKFESQKSETVTGVWKGVPKSELRRAPECYSEYTSLQADESAGFQSDRPENQGPRENKSTAVPSFVFLPHKNPSQFGQNTWVNIAAILRSQIVNSWQLEEAIMTIAMYNPVQSRNHGQHNPSERVDCRTLQAYFKTLSNEQSNHFFQTTLPRMQILALKLPDFFKEGLPILKQRVNQEVTLSQRQVACLLANAFFNTFPEQPHNYKTGKPLPLPDFNFINLYSQAKSERKIEKLKCIINYFERVTQKLPDGQVTYRRVYSPPLNWKTMEKTLNNLHVSTEGTIEDERGFLQADFANKFVGGGVLNTGLVQEEIRFVLCPEMIVSRLITEMLTNEEVLVMIGCERFSAYSGYSDSFKFTGDYVDQTERDEKGRMYTEVVAMDASVFRGDFYEQFKIHHVQRELNKAYCAFKRDGPSNLPAVCTGNWGCGAFGGDKQLKALIQLMAASAADRDICYLTFGEAQLCLQIGHIYEILKDRNMSIKDIMQILEEYSHSTTSDTVFKFLEDTITGNVNRREKSTRSDFPKPTSVQSKSSSRHTNDDNRPEKSTRSDVPKPASVQSKSPSRRTNDNRPRESTGSDVSKHTNDNRPEESTRSVSKHTSDSRPEESTRSDVSKRTNDNRPAESTRSVSKHTSDSRPEESTRSDVSTHTDDNRLEESTRSDVSKHTNNNRPEESTRSDVSKHTDDNRLEESTRSDVSKHTDDNRLEESTRSASKHTDV